MGIVKPGMSAPSYLKNIVSEIDEILLQFSGGEYDKPFLIPLIFFLK